MHHIDLKHEGLRKFRRLCGTDEYVLAQRARLQTEQWEEQWRRRVLLDRHTDDLLRQFPAFEARKAHAARLTVDAQQAVASLRNILAKGLDAPPFKMEMLYDSTLFPEPRPVPPGDKLPPPAPKRSDPRFDAVEIDLKDLLPLMLLSATRKREATDRLKQEAARAKYDLACKDWQAAREAVMLQNAKSQALFEQELDAWWDRAQAHQNRQQLENKKIDKFRQRYAQGHPDAVVEFLDAALSHSEYPDMFPMRWEMSFSAGTRALVVDYELPAPERFPRLKAVKFDVLRDDFAQSHFSEAEVADLYESAIYQTCLRSLHDALSADEAEVISSVTFNGWVNFTDKARDTPARACIISVQATKVGIRQANLLAADPKSSFQKLQGEAGARLADLGSVVPLLWLQRADDHLVAANDALGGADHATESQPQLGAEFRGFNS